MGGGGKETPRQKMVGVMYLFLTSLMALNVSKDVLNSFVLVSDSLEQTIANYKNKNQKVYDEFEKQMTQNPNKVKEWKDKADLVKKHSGELFDIIENHKYGLLERLIDRQVERYIDRQIGNSTHQYNPSYQLRHSKSPQDLVSALFSHD